MMNLIQRALRPLALRLRHMLVMGVVELVDSSKGVQELQVRMLSGEVRDRVPHLEPYGFTSRPHPGAEAGLVCMGGLREQALAFNVGDRRWRVKDLKTGEVALYTDEGDRIVLGRNGQVGITATGNLSLAAATKVTIGAGGDVEVTSATQLVVTAPLVHINGDLEVTGEITDRAGTNDVSMTDIRQVYNNHRHLEREVFGGPTDPPNSTLSN